MNNPQCPIARKNGLVVQDVPNEVLVYDTETNKAHCLNQTAALVWRSCDGKNDIATIADIVAAQTGSKVSEDLVWLAIDQLNENELLEAEVAPKFNGHSRRDAIKKIGLASMIALPIVASLVAPQSALASTSCTCVTITDCQLQPECPQGACTGGICTSGLRSTDTKKG
jgi:hypothetical protein